MSAGVRSAQSAFSSEISSYLIHMSSAQISFFETPGKKTYHEFLSDIASSEIMHYDPNNVGSKWWGDHDNQYAANYTVKELVDKSCNHVDSSLLESNFAKMEESTSIQMVNTLGGERETYNKLWRCGLLFGDTAAETENLAIWFDTHGGRPHRSAWSRTVYLMRTIYSLLGKDVQNPPESAKGSFANALQWAKTLFDDPSKDGAVLAQWRGAKQMFLQDYIAAVRQNLDPGQYAVSIAKKRIYHQLLGAGGFIVEAQGRKFELSSCGYGSSGLYYREFVLAETFTEGGENSFEATISAGFEISATSLFSASASFSAGWSKNWSVETSENPTEWKIVMEKSFLDRISPSATCTFARLILFMNWYIGGLSEWIRPLDDEAYGNMMLQDPIPVEVARFVHHIKIDSPFSFLDVLGAIDAGFSSRANISAVHTYKGLEGNVWKYERNAGTHKLREPSFSHKNARSVIGVPPHLFEVIVE